MTGHHDTVPTVADTRSFSDSEPSTTRDTIDIETHRHGLQDDLEKVYSKHDDRDATVVVSSVDPDVVDWNGPDDPENPLNWTSRKKWTNIWLLAAITMLTPLASSMFAPSVSQMMNEFHETSEYMASFVVTIYIIGYACGPLVIAPLSELYGRLWVYHINWVLFIIFTLACGLATNLSMLCVFRVLAGVFGSTPLTVGSGSIADTFRQDQRGKVLAVWTFPILFAPSVGPLIGSYLGEAAGWRWDFYSLAIAGGVLFIPALLIQRETYAPVLLERRAKRLRQETGNMKLRSALQSTKTPRNLLYTSLTRPLRMLCLSPIVFGLSLYIAIGYGYMYILITTLTPIFHGAYGISLKNVGLVYLGFGVGQFVGLFAFGAFSDRYLRHLAKGGEMKPEYRLPLIWPGFFATPIGLFIYGWTAQYPHHIHWIVPLIGQTFVGFGMITSFMPISTYLVDAYTAYAASAMAANTVLRSIGGAFLPLAGTKMYNALGLGWGNSLLAFIALAMFPMMWTFIRYGERLRTSKRFALNL